jgi:hypothetical protein
MNDAASLPRRFAFYPLLTCFLGALLAAGCGKPPSTSQRQESATTNIASVPAPTSAPTEPAGPGPGEKICFACKGEGTVACLVPGCVNGMVDCPGPCLKLSRGKWEHMDVAGHSPSDVWQCFPELDTHKGGHCWSQAHVGEVIAYQNNQPVNIGKCKICGGAGKVKCDVCKGTGRATCPVCNGKKFIPEAWTPTDNPYFNKQPDIIRLTDGRVLLGRVAATVSDELTIITRDKKILHVKSSDILPKAGTNSPAAKTPAAQ